MIVLVTEEEIVVALTAAAYSDKIVSDVGEIFRLERSYVKNNLGKNEVRTPENGSGKHTVWFQQNIK